MRKKCDATIQQAESIGRLARDLVFCDRDNFALTKMISAAVAAELTDLVFKIAQFLGVEQFVEAQFQRVRGFVVPEVRAVLATLGPFGRNSQSPADIRAGALGDGFHTHVWADLSALARRPLTLAGSGGKAKSNGIDQGTANFAVGDCIGGNIELKQAHRTLDVHTNWSGIDVRRRYHDAANWRTVSGVGIGIENELSHPPRPAGNDKPLGGRGIETG